MTSARQKLKRLRFWAILCLATLLIISCSGRLALPPATDQEPGTAITQETRTVEHALGKTEVPSRPKRVVVMNPVVDLDNLLALGIKPVGLAAFTKERPFPVPPYLARQAEGVESVGDLTQPNLEKTLLLNPDLIIISESQRRLYRQLSQIAPTVGMSPRVGQWQDRFLALAEAVNQTETATQLLDEFDQKVAAFKQTLGDRLTDVEISYIRVRTDGIFLYVKSSLVGDVMTDLGLKRPPAQDIVLARSPRIPISLEELEKADGDVMFVFGVEFGDTQDMFAQLQTNPLWQQLNAVKTNQVHIVTETYWSFPGIQGANLLIDDLTQYLTQYLTDLD
ncbi:MAG: iron-siderophore ABC transporter substrate-binding protein [Cyanobacteria bacterium P01_D01_bin.128]